MNELRKPWWDPCIFHRGSDLEEFLKEYFPNRKVLYVGGAGFDPRACTVAEQLLAAGPVISALLIKEARPSPSNDQLSLADGNTRVLTKLLPQRQILPVDIFSADGAVVGGRFVVNAVSQCPISPATDVVIDMSALSLGTSFPLVKYFHERAKQAVDSFNLHVFLTHEPTIDDGIRSVSCDSPDFLHGFRGDAPRFRGVNSARMWLPQLSSEHKQALEKLFDFIKPNDTCPILPFPASDPRLGDKLAVEYQSEFEGAWAVDARDIVYADEGDPLDLYRTILRLGDFRRSVFEEYGESVLVLSPLGSKVMALGALMAALDRNHPVAHVETDSYKICDSVYRCTYQPEIFHIWLEGDVYPPRSS